MTQQDLVQELQLEPLSNSEHNITKFAILAGELVPAVRRKGGFRQRRKLGDETLLSDGRKLKSSDPVCTTNLGRYNYRAPGCGKSTGVENAVLTDELLQLLPLGETDQLC